MAHRVRNVNVRNRAKFRGNLSKHDRDIAIFEFQDSSRPPSWILNIQNFNGQQSYEGKHASSYAKFRGNR